MSWLRGEFNDLLNSSGPIVIVRGFAVPYPALIVFLDLFLKGTILK